ncbi:MAG: alpha/beta hydrolase [Clostridiales bacterium]|nr:alpha/beta hydrolase [Clostridiales bacterium]
MKKAKKIILITLLVVLVLFIGVCAFAGNYFYDLALNPNSDKSSVLGAPQNDSGDYDHDAYQQRQQANYDWMDEKGGTAIQMTSYDNLSLNAYVIKNEEPSDNWVVICHGYTGFAKQMIGSAREFYTRGYNILLPDARGGGDSEGDYIGMGWDERKDITNWIERINADYTAKNVILYGVSMGGATVMMTSGEDLPDNVRAIVEDCGYTSVWDEFSHQLSGIFKLPDFPIMHAASIVTKIRAGYTLGEASAVEQVAKSVTPMLFIHGGEDTFVPTWMLDVVYDAANCEKEKLLIQGAGHGAASSADPELYWSTIDNFLAKYVK